MASVKDFTPFGFDLTACKQISEEDYAILLKSGCVPKYKDVLVGKDGARYFEDILLFTQKEQIALLSSIAILRCKTDVVIPEYLYYLLKAPNVRKNVRSNYGSGSAIPRIVLKDFKRMPISYPSLSEQHQIVALPQAIDAQIHAIDQQNDNLAA